MVVKGTEFFDGKLGRYVDCPVTDVLQMMGRAGRPVSRRARLMLIATTDTSMQREVAWAVRCVLGGTESRMCPKR